MVELAYYKPVKSNRKGKKMMVRIYLPKEKKDKIIHFGNVQYQDYTQHHNLLRRKRYLYRSGFLRKGGKLSKNDYTSPNFWSRKYLWKSNDKVFLPKPPKSRI
jgi:hypothetical protein